MTRACLVNLLFVLPPFARIKAAGGRKGTQCFTAPLINMELIRASEEGRKEGRGEDASRVCLLICRHYIIFSFFQPWEEIRISSSKSEEGGEKKLVTVIIILQPRRN